MSYAIAQNVSVHGVPHELTTFIGRNVELIELRRLLRERRSLNISRSTL